MTIPQLFLVPLPLLIVKVWICSTRATFLYKKLRIAEKTCNCGYVNIQLRSNILLKSYKYAVAESVAEFLPSFSAIAIADMMKAVHAHLCQLP
jgi:hypothetical protein